MNTITTCLWFDGQAEEAAKFYSAIFHNSKIGKKVPYTETSAKMSGQKKDSTMTIEFEIENQKILGLNGGPAFKFTQAFSFFVWCDSEKEIDELWSQLSAGGNVRMGLDKYPWASKYGFTSDKFGVEWQLILKSNKQKIAPAFLFVNKLFGRGEEAINFYTSLFKDSKIDMLAKDEKTKSVMHGVFSLCGQPFVLMEGQGQHEVEFNEAFSLVIECENQKEMDFFWNKLTDGGAPSACGWLKDKFGVSWQVVPKDLRKIMTGDLNKVDNVMKAVMGMTKLDLEKLKSAASR